MRRKKKEEAGVGGRGEDKGRSKEAKGSEHMLRHTYTHTCTHAYTHTHIHMSVCQHVKITSR